MIVIEDGTVVSSANSYVTVSGVTDYANNYGYTTTWSGSTVTDTIREQSLLKAMRYIESLPFRGIKQTQDQPLQFPRSELYDDSKYLLADNTIPSKLISAVCEATMLMLPDSDIDLEPNITRDNYQTGLQVTGAIQEVWSFETDQLRNRSTIIEGLLKELVRNKTTIEIRRS